MDRRAWRATVNGVTKVRHNWAANTRFVIDFLARSKCLLISWLQSPSAVILKPKVSHCFYCFPIYLSWSDGTGSHDFVLWLLNFKPVFSLCSFTLIKRFFSFSSLSASTVVLSAYVRLLIFLPTILIPACDSSSPAFHMIYSACNLNKQGDNIQPCWTPFPILNQLVFPCPGLTFAS